MKTLLSISGLTLFAFLFLHGYSQEAKLPTIKSELFTLTDAKNILGSDAFLSDSSVKSKDSVTTGHFVYEAKNEMPGNIKSRIYVLFEHYIDESMAQQKYAFIKSANADHEGIKVLNDVGDEAYFHSDDKNFCFIIVRKGNAVFSMKVNKLTSETSLKEFNLTAKRIGKML